MRISLLWKHMVRLPQIREVVTGFNTYNGQFDVTNKEHNRRSNVNEETKLEALFDEVFQSGAVLVCYHEDDKRLPMENTLS